MSDRFEQAADTLIQARRTGVKIASFPEDLSPQSVDEAYEIQDRMIGRLGPVGGWKVLAGGSDPNPLCSPLPSSVFHQDGAVLDAGKLLLHLTEVEVAVRLGSDFPERPEPYTPDDILPAVQSLHPAFELISSPFVDRSQIAKLTLLSDFQSNGAVIVGPGITHWDRLDLSRLPIKLAYDGHEVARTEKGASFQEILVTLAWLANHAMRRGHPLMAGNVIITGSRIVHDAFASEIMQAELDGLGTVTVNLRA